MHSALLYPRDPDLLILRHLQCRTRPEQHADGEVMVNKPTASVMRNEPARIAGDGRVPGPPRPQLQAPGRQQVGAQNAAGPVNGHEEEVAPPVLPYAAPGQGNHPGGAMQPGPVRAMGLERFLQLAQQDQEDEWDSDELDEDLDELVLEEQPRRNRAVDRNWR